LNPSQNQMRLMSILSIALVGIIFISSQSTPAFAENSTSISNYTEPIIENYTEPEIISEPISTTTQPTITTTESGIPTTMNVEIIDDKVVVSGTISQGKNNSGKWT